MVIYIQASLPEQLMQIVNMAGWHHITYVLYLNRDWLINQRRGFDQNYFVSKTSSPSSLVPNRPAK